MNMNQQNDLPFFQSEEDSMIKSLFKQNARFDELISCYAKQYGLGNIIHVDEPYEEKCLPVTAGINSLCVPNDIRHQFSAYCFRQNLPVLYPANMKWGAAVIVSDNHSPINIAKKTKTGNYNDDIRAYIGRYVSFWSRQTPASLLLNNDPVLSNTLMLQTSLYVLATIASRKAIKLFPDMYYCFCNPGERI